MSKIIDVIIEIPYNTFVKYEYDEKYDKMRCDRILPYNIITSNEIEIKTGKVKYQRTIKPKITYPGNYGYIPNTLAGDGDPLDILMVCDYQLKPNTIVEAKIIGVLIMEDEKGRDEKIIVVPSTCVDITYENINEIDDLPPFTVERIEYFFKHYKDEDKDRWSKVIGYSDSSEACEILDKALLSVVQSTQYSLS